MRSSRCVATSRRMRSPVPPYRFRWPPPAGCPGSVQTRTGRHGSPRPARLQQLKPPPGAALPTVVVALAELVGVLEAVVLLQDGRARCGARPGCARRRRSQHLPSGHARAASRRRCGPRSQRPACDPPPAAAWVDQIDGVPGRRPTPTVSWKVLPCSSGYLPSRRTAAASPASAPGPPPAAGAQIGRTASRSASRVGIQELVVLVGE